MHTESKGEQCGSCLDCPVLFPPSVPARPCDFAQSPAQTVSLMNALTDPPAHALFPSNASGHIQLLQSLSLSELIFK